MAVEYLYPATSDDVDAEWAIGGDTPAGTKHESIDDTQGADDEDTTFIKSTSVLDEQDGQLGDCSALQDADTINEVRVYWVGEETSGHADARLDIGVRNAADSDYTTVEVNASAPNWTHGDFALALDPTGNAWTLARINALFWYVESNWNGKNAGVEWRLTSFYLKITYTVAAGGVVGQVYRRTIMQGV